MPATDDLGQRDDAVYCRSLVDAARATARQAGDAKVLIERADSISIWSLTVISGPGTFIEAVLLARAGDIPGARRIMQREAVQVQDPLYLYAAYLRERGRLALLDHDTVAARDHWGQYLALRAHAEPALQPAVDSIRKSLQRLN